MKGKIIIAAAVAVIATGMGVSGAGAAVAASQADDLLSAIPEPARESKPAPVASSPHQAPAASPAPAQRTTQRPASALTRNQVMQYAGEMYQSYRWGGAYEMQAFEDDCWASVSQGRVESARVCATYAYSGVLIEAARSQVQRRTPVPYYLPATAAERIEQSPGPSNELRAEILASTVGQVEDILVGLTNAGMR